jgi:hypothetical protein
MELSKINNVVFENIDFNDYPDYSDAYIFSADYDGKPMSKIELDSLPSEWVYELLIKQLD